MLKTIVKTIRKIKDPGSNGNKRSPKWETVRKTHLEKNPTCAATGLSEKDGAKLEVHHIVPFSHDSSKELDPSNLITLARKTSMGVDAHIIFGHLGSFKSSNPNVEKDAAYIKEMLSHKEENKK